MLKNFETQKEEIRSLHKKYKSYLNKEYSERDYSCFLSNP